MESTVYIHPFGKDIKLVNVALNFYFYVRLSKMVNFFADSLQLKFKNFFSKMIIAFRVIDTEGYIVLLKTRSLYNAIPVF